jgi:hypothetical protein
MINRRGPIVVALALAAAALLAGCAAPKVQQTTAPTTTPPVSATPTPTPTADALPQARVPLNCANLFTASAVSGLVDGTVTVAGDETSPLTDFQSIASRQLGTLTCVWGGKDRTDGGYDQGLILYISPDSAANFAANLAGLKKVGSLTILNTAGDESAYGCNSSTGYYCNANMLVGGYWLTATLQDNLGKTKVSVSAANKRMQKVLDSVARALAAAAPAVAAWMPPTASSSGFCTDADRTALIRSAFTSPHLLPHRVAANSLDALTIAESGDAYGYCDWQQANLQVEAPKGQTSDVYVEELAGGAWAIPQLVASPPNQFYFGKYKSITIPGTTGALLGCNNADCNAILGVGPNAIEIGVANIGTPKLIAGLTAIAAAAAG